MTEPDKEIITELGLKELIKIYDGELERQKNLDTKAASLLGFTSIVVTILLFNIKYFLDNPTTMSALYYILITLSVLILAVSLFFLINSILVRDYEQPVQYNKGKSLRRYLTTYPEDDFKELIVSRYIDCIPINYKNNEDKADALKLGTIFLASGVLAALFSPIIIFLTACWRF